MTTNTTVAAVKSLIVIGALAMGLTGALMYATDNATAGQSVGAQQGGVTTVEIDAPKADSACVRPVRVVLAGYGVENGGRACR
jgi:hypothetical protein